MAELHKRSVAQEVRTAKILGGQRSPMSGAGWARKNDVRDARFLVENKRTDNRSGITLKAKDLEGLRRNALRSGRLPLLQFDLNERHYYVVCEDDLLEMVGEQGGTELRAAGMGSVLRRPRGRGEA